MTEDLHSPSVGFEIVIAVQRLQDAFDRAGLRRPIALVLDSPIDRLKIGAILLRDYGPFLFDGSKPQISGMELRVRG